jgi:hypothetical protein
MPRQPRRSPDSAGGLPWRHAGAGSIRGLRKTKFKKHPLFQLNVADARKPFGSTCIRNRRMNSCGVSVMVFQRPGPSMR